jgi:peptidoglycan/LPS O-acetylase OafA/YrhL
MGFARSLAARHRPKPGTGTNGASVTGAWLSRAARYANEAVLPFYLLHEPVIVAAAWFIVRWHAPITGKYAALVIASFAATLALYETLVWRFRATRLLFGMKPRIKSSAANNPTDDG